MSTDISLQTGPSEALRTCTSEQLLIHCEFAIRNMVNTSAIFASCINLGKVLDLLNELERRRNETSKVIFGGGDFVATISLQPDDLSAAGTWHSLRDKVLGIYALPREVFEGKESTEPIKKNPFYRDEP